MKKRILTLLIFIVLTILIIPNIVFADTKVSVTLPDFKVSLNGTEVDNTYRQYPLITYKGITYFPMTYYDCRYLGLETTWDAVKGLGINKLQVSAPYNPYAQKVKNSNTQTASIPRFKISLNNKTIDNSKEEYPLLVFRDVTYFPMTWKFCVNEFGWKYNFDSKNGLVIKSSNPVVEKISFANCNGNFTATEKYYVYQGTDGLIYRAPKNDVKKYSFANEKLDFSDIYPWFYKSNGELMMAHRVGGASIGGIFYYTINDDGTISEPIFARERLKKYDNLIVDTYYGSVGPIFETLRVFDISNMEYAIRVYSDYDKYAAISFGDFYLVGRDLYFSVRYGTYDENKGGYNYAKEGLFKSNIDTDEEVQLLDKYVQSFQIDGQNIYYMQNDQLYKTDLNNTTTPVILANEKHISSFSVINGNIFYVEKNGELLYSNTNKKPLVEDKKVSSISTIDNYIVSEFRKDNYNPKGFAIYDNKGSMVFKSEDDVEFKSLNNDTAYFTNTVNNNTYSVKLK